MGNNVGRPGAILGTDAGIEQGTKLRWNIHTGETQVRTWKGPANKVKALYDGYKSFTAGVPDFDDLTFDAGRGVGTLEATKSGMVYVNGQQSAHQDAESRWELLAVEERVPVEYSPAFKTLSHTDVQEVRNGYLTPGFSKPAAWDVSPGLKGKLFDLLVRGCTDYLDFMYVARRTITTTLRSTLEASYLGINSTVWTGSDGSVVHHAPAIDNPIFSGIRNEDIEWLKRPPQVREIERHRWVIEEEWWGIAHDAGSDKYGRCGWSGVLYGGRALP